jgi:energy-coupling factor transporter ATP-binding protein EcfA2
LNIAIALLQQPDVLLLDEPTVGVDPQSRAFLLEQVRALAAQGTAIVYATHYMEEVMACCNEIVLLDHGRVLAGGANVVLAAIAGIMVPRPLMPAGMQTLSEWSPMGWALDGMQTVFLGAPDAAQVLPKAGLLLAFAGVCLLLGWRPIRRSGRPT